MKKTRFMERETDEITIILDQDNAEMVRRFCNENGFRVGEGVNRLLRDFCVPCGRCEKCMMVVNGDRI